MSYHISFISLGCAKNLVNCEQMMALCRDAGHAVREAVPGSDVCVINTCGFIDSAKEEAIDTIQSTRRPGRSRRSWSPAASPSAIRRS